MTGRDFSDVLRDDGPEAVAKLIEDALEYEPSPDELEDAQNPLPKGARRGVEPYYSATPLEPGEVSAQLREEVTSFFENAAHYSLVMREIEQAKQDAVENFHHENPIGLNYLGRITELPLIDAALLDPEETYDIRIRSLLSTEDFPSLLRFLAFWRRDWSLRSDWFRWQLGD